MSRSESFAAINSELVDDLQVRLQKKFQHRKGMETTCNVPL